jgi:outer membrane protein TolC
MKSATPLNRGRLGALVLFGLLVFVELDYRPQSIGAQESPSTRQGLTLEQCIAVALENQPGLHALQTGVDIAREQKHIAESYYYPHVDLTARPTQLSQSIHVQTADPLTGPINEVLSDAAAFFGLARQVSSAAALQALANPQGAVFSAAKQAVNGILPTSIQTNILGDTFLLTNVLVTQPLYTGGKIRLQNQRARLGVELAEVQVAKGRQQVAFEVSRAYLSILLTLELQQFIAETEERFGIMEKLVHDLIEEGDRSVRQADESRLSALRKLAKSQLAQIQRDTDLARAGLRTAMGLDPDQAVEIAESRLGYRSVSPDLARLQDRALNQRPEIATARLGMRNAELERRLAIAQFCPDVGLFGQFTSIQDTPSYLSSNIPNLWAGGIQASVPLFEGGRRLAARRQAAVKYAQASEFLPFLEQGVTLEVQKAYLEYQAMVERLPLAAGAVRDALTTLRSYDTQYATGSVVDYSKYMENVTTARLLLLGARVEYAQLRSAYFQRAYAYIERKEYDRAIVDLDEAIRLDPTYAIAYNERGYAHNQLGHYAQGLRDLDEAIRLDPNNGMAYDNRGYSYQGLGDNERAEEDWATARRLKGR